jgi:surfactin synthase thioesterase subunit
MTVIEEAASRWLPLRDRSGPAALPLFCLPHAGAGASAFRTWQGKLGGVAVLPVQPPGREARFRDEPYQHMTPLVRDLATVLLAEMGDTDQPYGVYGHSLGALVAFELVRELRRRGGPAPVRLVVSGCVAPHRRFDDGPPVANMAQPDLVRMLRRLGGTPEWLLSDPTALELFLPAVRADFSVKETYSYLAESPLAVPLTVLSSTADPRASHEAQTAWRDQTTGVFESHTFAGGHFAVFEQAARTHRHLAEALRPWVSP